MFSFYFPQISPDYQNPYDLLQQKIAKEKGSPEGEKQIEMGKLCESPTKLKELVSQTKMNIIQKEEPVEEVDEFEKIFQTRYEKLKFGQKIKRLLTPFSWPYKQKWVH